MARDTRPRATIHSVFNINEDIVTEKTGFSTARTQSLYRWWSSFDAPPRLASFRPAQHPLIAAHMFVVERVDGEWRFGHYGDQTQRLLDSEPTGRWVKEYSIERYGLPLEDYYTSVVTLGQCVKCFGMLSVLGRKDVLFESIDCPIADDAGALNGILGVMDAVTWEGSRF